MSRPIIVMSTGAYQAALNEILRLFEGETGFATRPIYASAAAIAGRIEAGEGFDVAVSTQASMAALAETGFVAKTSRQPAGSNAVCLAYRQDAPAPEAATPDALRATLLNAASISLSDPVHGGGSSKFFMDFVKSLGIEAAITPKLIFTPGGQGAAPVGAGRAQIGIAQTSEIAMVPGLAAAPLLPGHPESSTGYEIATSPHAPAAAAALVAFLAGPAGLAIRRKCGLAGEL
jgi:molybdate transport system substrate-binding protein